MSEITGAGTPATPWELATPPGTSSYQAYRDEAADPPALVVQVGKWRRQTTINVTSCVSAAVPPASSRLPKNHGEGNMPPGKI